VPPPARAKPRTESGPKALRITCWSDVWRGRPRCCATRSGITVKLRPSQPKLASPIFPILTTLFAVLRRHTVGCPRSRRCQLCRTRLIVRLIVLGAKLPFHLSPLYVEHERSLSHVRQSVMNRGNRRAAILRAIENRSGDPNLSAAAVAKLLGYVYLLVAETGRSFTHHLLERRLEKAALMLRDARWGQRKIADIAVEAGFTDLSYFNRAFRRGFGLTPTQMRDQARQPQARIGGGPPPGP
jgi:AraC-like DNA-binding protein